MRNSNWCFYTQSLQQKGSAPHTTLIIRLTFLFPTYPGEEDGWGEDAGQEGEEENQSSMHTQKGQQNVAISDLRARTKKLHGQRAFNQ